MSAAVTAARLRQRCEADVAAAEKLLEEEPSPPAEAKKVPVDMPAAHDQERPAIGGSRRAVWIMGGSIMMLTVAIIVMARSSGPDAPAALQPPVDLSGAESPFADMVAAVADDPTNNALRLALAGMHFELGEYMPAIEHYFVVIEGEALPEQRSIALGRVGFMVSVTEQYGAPLLDRAAGTRRRRRPAPFDGGRHYRAATQETSPPRVAAA